MVTWFRPGPTKNPPGNSIPPELSDGSATTVRVAYGDGPRRWISARSPPVVSVRNTSGLTTVSLDTAAVTGTPSTAPVRSANVPTATLTSRATRFTACQRRRPAPLAVGASVGPVI